MGAAALADAFASSAGLPAPFAFGFAAFGSSFRAGPAFAAGFAFAFGAGAAGFGLAAFDAGGAFAFGTAPVTPREPAGAAAPVVVFGFAGADLPAGAFASIFFGGLAAAFGAGLTDATFFFAGSAFGGGFFAAFGAGLGAAFTVALVAIWLCSATLGRAGSVQLGDTETSDKRCAVISQMIRYRRAYATDSPISEIARSRAPGQKLRDARPDSEPNPSINASVPSTVVI